MNHGKKEFPGINKNRTNKTGETFWGDVFNQLKVNLHLFNSGLSHVVNFFKNSVLPNHILLVPSRNIYTLCDSSEEDKNSHTSSS